MLYDKDIYLRILISVEYLSFTRYLTTVSEPTDEATYLEQRKTEKHRRHRGKVVCVPNRATIHTIPQGLPYKSLSSSCVETLGECPEAAQILRHAAHEAAGCKGALSLISPRYPQPSRQIEHTFNYGRLSA